jgi:hypothetical protein
MNAPRAKRRSVRMDCMHCSNEWYSSSIDFRVAVNYSNIFWWFPTVKSSVNIPRGVDYDGNSGSIVGIVIGLRFAPTLGLLRVHLTCIISSWMSMEWLKSLTSVWGMGKMRKSLIIGSHCLSKSPNSVLRTGHCDVNIHRILALFESMKICWIFAWWRLVAVESWVSPIHHISKHSSGKVAEKSLRLLNTWGR